MRHGLRRLAAAPLTAAIVLGVRATFASVADQWINACRRWCRDSTLDRGRPCRLSPPIAIAPPRDGLQCRVRCGYRLTPRRARVAARARRRGNHGCSAPGRGHDARCGRRRWRGCCVLLLPPLVAATGPLHRRNALQRLGLPTLHRARVDRRDHRRGDRLALAQHVLRHHRDAARHPLIGVHDRPGAHGLVRLDRGLPTAVGAVDIGDIDVGHAVARLVDLARRQGHPTHRWATADVDADAHVGAANPGHQRRGIDRPRDVLARRPGPAPAPRDPAAVVKGREAPGRIVDPGVAPRPHVGPVTVAIRCPARLDAARQPKGAVLRVAIPVAIAVEVVGAGHLWRDVGAAARVAFVLSVLLRRPLAEAIVGQRRPAVVRHTPLIPEFGALTGIDLQRAVTRLEAHGPGNDAAKTAVLLLVDAVVPGASGLETAFTSGDVELARRLVAAQTQCQAAMMQVQAHTVVVELRHFQFGAAVQAHRGRPDLQLGPRVALGREAIARGQRPIAPRRDPLALLSIEHPNRTDRFRDAADAAWRVGPDAGAGEQRNGRHAERGQAVKPMAGLGVTGSDAHLRSPRRCAFGSARDSFNAAAAAAADAFTSVYRQRPGFRQSSDAASSSGKSTLV